MIVNVSVESSEKVLHNIVSDGFGEYLAWAPFNRFDEHNLYVVCIERFSGKSNAAIT